VAERFGQRPSNLINGGLIELLFDMHVAGLLAREEERALRKIRKR